MYELAAYDYDNYLQELKSYTSAMITKFMLLVGSAGNGKTNLMCNLAELIIRTGQPCVFINARDCKEDVIEYFLKIIDKPRSEKFPQKPDFLLSCINIWLGLQKKKMYILIDAINENDEEIFKNSISDFVNFILRYSNFKIMMSIRSEYFDERYSRFFEEKININPFIYNVKECPYDERAVNKLEKVYRQHFNFTGRISNKIFVQLSKSLLFMRIFFETKRNNSENILSLNKYELYKKYIEDVQNKNGDFNVEKFLMKVSKIMLNKEIYDEIPIEWINLNDNEIEKIKKFTDDNILISRIVKLNPNTIAEIQTEQLYFVFDELRDYCLTRYLMKKCVVEKDKSYGAVFKYAEKMVKAKASPVEGELSESEMQKIARELNNSETAFIFSSTSNDYDVHIRFFTPTNEVPICGHATIAANYALAIENDLDTTRVYQKTGAGIVPVDIIKENYDYKIVMTQGKVEFGSIIDGVNRNKLIDALGVKQSDLIENQEIQIVSTGHSKVLVGIKNIETLSTLKPNYDALVRLSNNIKCNGYYVFTIDSDDKDILIHGRMFAPAIGINEDPVTGNANGPLGAYLVRYNLVQHNRSDFKFRAMQGEAINRSGIIEVEVKIEKNEPTEVKISGSAVIVFQSEIDI